jgi:hypothetical protein
VGFLPIGHLWRGVIALAQISLIRNFCRLGKAVGYRRGIPRRHAQSLGKGCFVRAVACGPRARTFNRFAVLGKATGAMGRRVQIAAGNEEAVHGLLCESTDHGADPTM